MKRRNILLTPVPTLPAFGAEHRSKCSCGFVAKLAIARTLQVQEEVFVSGS